ESGHLSFTEIEDDQSPQFGDFFEPRIRNARCAKIERPQLAQLGDRFERRIGNQSPQRSPTIQAANFEPLEFGKAADFFEPRVSDSRLPYVEGRQLAEAGDFINSFVCDARVSQR